MVRAMLRSDVRLGYVVWLASLALVLGASVAAGVSRERLALPRAAEQLRLAGVDAGLFLSCFQGANDELVPSGSAGVWTRFSVLTAKQRLETCDLDAVRSRVDAIDVPLPAAVNDEGLREGRLAIEAAEESLRRMILEAEGTVDVLERELRTGRGGAAIPLGIRAVETEFRQVALWLGRATRALDV